MQQCSTPLRTRAALPALSATPAAPAGALRASACRPLGAAPAPAALATTTATPARLGGRGRLGGRLWRGRRRLCALPLAHSAAPRGGWLGSPPALALASCLFAGAAPGLASARLGAALLGTAGQRVGSQTGQTCFHMWAGTPGGHSTCCLTRCAALMGAWTHHLLEARDFFSSGLSSWAWPVTFSSVLGLCFTCACWWERHGMGAGWCH